MLSASANLKRAYDCKEKFLDFLTKTYLQTSNSLSE